MNFHDFFLVAISSVTSGTAIGAIVALMKVRAEKGKILVDSASSVVVMQSDLIRRLEDRIKELETEIVIYREKVSRLEEHLFDIDERMKDGR